MERLYINWSTYIEKISENVKIIDNCLFLLHNTALKIASNMWKSPLKIGEVDKEFSPKKTMKVIQNQQKNSVIKPIYLIINKEGEIILEEYEDDSLVTLNFLYVFNTDCKEIETINEISCCYKNSLLFFQGEYLFQTENSSSSFVFEIPIDFSPEIDYVQLQCRKNQEFSRIVVHSSGFIQIKPQINLYVYSCNLMKTPSEVQEVSLEIVDKTLVSSKYKSVLFQNFLVIIEGLLEFSQEENERVFGKIKESSFFPKKSVCFFNCLKEKWDFTVVTINTAGEMSSSKGKSIWLKTWFII